MIPRAAIVTEARSWVGTPFHWQQAVKGRGCDCKGLVAGVARSLGMPEGYSIYAAMMADRSGRVDCRLLKEGLAATLAPTDDPQPGDVLLLRMAAKPQHLAILGHGEAIHTYGRGPRRVTAMPLAVALRAWPLDSAWTWPSLGAVA